MNSTQKDMRQRFEEVKANNAVEGIFYTADEEALFHHMIDLGLNAEQRKQMIDDYIADNCSLQAAAE